MTVKFIFLFLALLTACARPPADTDAPPNTAQPYDVMSPTADKDKPAYTVSRYMPLAETLKRAGFTQDNAGDVITFTNGDLTLIFEPENLCVKKDIFTYYLSGKSEYINGVLCVEERTIDKMIGRRIISNDNDITFEDFDFKPHAWTNYSLIAHACGGILELNGRNCLEAFVTNYNNGHTVFEVDLLTTLDKQIAAIHDWDGYGYGGRPMTYEEFKNIKIYDVFTPMDFDELLRIMALNKEIFIVTDTKSYEDDESAIKEQFEIMRDKANAVDGELLNRIIPQIYNQEMYYIIKDVYPFESIIYTLYASPDTDEEVVKFVKDKDDIKVITMGDVRFSNDFYKKLTKNGKFIYLFTLNDPDLAGEFFNRGVRGVYTDFILP